MRAGSGLWRRRIVMSGTLGIALVVGAGLAAGADGGLTITPASGAPGTAYEVNVSCGEQPLLYRHNLQDDYVQGTIAPFPSDQVAEVSPWVWAFDGTAGRADAQYSATCAGATAGSARFDAEAPHLWFGPRPRYIASLDPSTRVEGTDCPDGTTATVAITADGKTSTSNAPIDQYGDWSVALPAPVGSTEFTINASCGAVVYDALQATTTVPGKVTETTASNVTSPPTGPTPASPAAPQSATADFTG